VGLAILVPFNRLLDVGGNYGFMQGRIYNLRADEIIADHAESNPALDATLTLVPAAVKAVAALHHANASFTASPPFLPVAEPALLLFRLRSALLVLRWGTQTRLTPFSCAVFSLLAE
jgi:hypothetical protein